MGKTRIGDVTVANGGNVKWGLLASIIIGTPVYAYYRGFVGLVLGFGEFVQHDVLGGVRSFVVSLVDLEFLIASVAARSAWWEFGASVRGSGVFAYVLAVAVFGGVLFLMLVLLRKGVSVLVG
jgi:hypothetical protein